VANTFLLFGLKNELFAVDAMAVKEVFFLPEITSIEEAPAFIVGIINLRGAIVPVMDLGLRFGHARQKYNLSDAVIVLEIENRSAGIIVSQVNDVIEIPSFDIQPPPFDHFVGGEARVGDQLIMLLDHAKLLTEPVPESPRTAEQLYFCPEASPEERAVFHERAHNLAAASVEEEPAGLTPVAVMGLNGEYFGVELDTVSEFAEIQNLSPVPCCPPHIAGNMNLRGSVMTLLNIRELLDLPTQQTTAAGMVVVSKYRDLLAGVVVDQIYSIVRVRTADIMPAPAVIEKTNAKYIKGTVVYNDRVMTLLDLPAILNEEKLIVNEEM